MHPSKRVFVITDSLSLPRQSWENCEWDDIYVELLKNRFPKINFIHLAIGKATSGTLLEQSIRYYCHCTPDMVILQCGLVDCAPRALKSYELFIFKKLRLMRFIKKHKETLRSIRKIHYTIPKKFEKNIQSMKEIFHSAAFYSIAILPPQKQHTAIAPGIESQINLYNDILKSETNFIQVEDFPNDGYADDNYHMNKIGHAYIYNKLEPIIDSYYK